MKNWYNRIKENQVEEKSTKLFPIDEAMLGGMIS